MRRITSDETVVCPPLHPWRPLCDARIRCWRQDPALVSRPGVAVRAPSTVVPRSKLRVGAVTVRFTSLRQANWECLGRPRSACANQSSAVGNSRLRSPLTNRSRLLLTPPDTAACVTTTGSCARTLPGVLACPSPNQVETGQQKRGRVYRETKPPPIVHLCIVCFPSPVNWIDGGQRYGHNRLIRRLGWGK